MASAMTQAQMRDEVRRLMEIVPPIDTSSGSAGDEPPGQADPQNVTINSAINQGLSAINRVVRLGPVTQLNVAVTAAGATRLGKQYVDVSGTVSPALSLNELEDMIFTPTAGTPLRLMPYDYYAKQKSFDPLQQYPPGKPQMFKVAGNQVLLIPGTSTGGTLYFDATAGIDPFTADGSSTALLPYDHQWTPIYWAVAILSARKASDLVAAARAEKFGQMAREGTMAIYLWRNGFGNKEAIASVRQTLSMMDLGQPVQAQAQGAPAGQGQ